MGEDLPRLLLVLALIKFVVQVTDRGHLGRAVANAYISMLESDILIKHYRSLLVALPINIVAKKTLVEDFVSNLTEYLVFCILVNFFVWLMPFHRYTRLAKQ